MPREPKKVRKTLQYWLAQLIALNQFDIKIIPDCLLDDPTPGWSVYIGDFEEWSDYWRDNPRGMSFSVDLSQAIQGALDRYKVDLERFNNKNNLGSSNGKTSGC
jgi:hypothetical protein